MKLLLLIALSYFVFIGSWFGCLLVGMVAATIYCVINKNGKHLLWGAAVVTLLTIAYIMIEAYGTYSIKLEASKRGEVPSEQAK